MALLNQRAIAACLVVLMLCNVARADDPTWKVRWEIEVPVVAVELTISFAWLLGPQLSPAHCAPLCDRNDVWVVDRFAAGLYSKPWARVGDAGVGVVFAGALVTMLADEGWAAGFSDYFVWVESVLGAMALANLTNIAVHRPRPYLYSEEASLDERMSGKGSLSFFSGHTATAFAGTMALFQMLRTRHPDGAGQWVALGTGLAIATTIGVSRVLAGEHFPTDALAGAVVGTAVGWLVPALHEHNIFVSGSVDSTGASLSLSRAF